ncbi:MAG: hypothetical protein V4504_00120 [Patescibacteria group bacterium]
MQKKMLSTLTLTELWGELKSYADGIKVNDSKKILNELSRLIQQHKGNKETCDELITKLLRIPVWLLRNKVTKPSIILIALHRNSPKELVEELSLTYGEKFASSIELLRKKDYESNTKEERASLRLEDFKNAVEKSKEAALILLAEHSVNRIDFTKEEDDDKKILWSIKNQPRVEILHNFFLKNFKTEQNIVLSIKDTTTILIEDLACMKGVLQLVKD